MAGIKQFKSRETMKLAVGVFERNGKVWLGVTGSSMYPFLRSDRDMVQLAKADIHEVELFDIVLIQRLNGDYILHRLVEKSEDQRHFFLCGDAQKEKEGPFFPSQLIAKVCAVRKGKRELSCQSAVWKWLVKKWHTSKMTRDMFFFILSFRRKCFR